MNTIQKLLTGALLVAVISAGFYFAEPAKAKNVAEQIASIREQIASLQQKLNELLTQNDNTVTWCYTFSRNLKFGNSGTDIANLQIALAKEGLYTNDSSSKKFDEKLASAVVAFQQKYASEILTPSGLTNGTGYVGPATRAKLNQFYACNNNQQNNKLKINSVLGPTNLNVNQTGTWTVNVVETDNRPLTFTVNWGDQVLPTGTLQNFPGSLFSQTATFTHAYNATGNYVAIFSVSDNAGHTVTKTLNISVGTQTTLPPVVYNQSLSINKNTTTNITLTGLDPQTLALSFTVVTNPIHGTLTGTAPNLTYTPNIDYTGTDNFTFKANNGTQDSSTAVISITVKATPTNNYLSINSISGPMHLKVGQLGSWTINVLSNNNSNLTYAVTWGDELQTVLPANSNLQAPVNNQQTLGLTHTYSTVGNYTVTVKVTNSSGASAVSTISVAVDNN
jgi:hypothetical protein